MSRGPINFSPPYHLDKPVLDGITLSGRPKPFPKTPSWGANVIEHYDHGMTLQLDYHDSDDQLDGTFYQWPISAKAITDEGWRVLDELRVTHEPVYWIDYGVEVAAFKAGPELTDFVLRRPTAESVLTSFDAAKYPTKAWLNRVAQTVISSGTPTSGQVKVSGSAVTTPTLGVNDSLVIRYVAAYSVVVTAAGFSYLDTNDLQGDFVLIEARGAS